MPITITATKAGRFGKPAVEIAFDPGTKLDEILAAGAATARAMASETLREVKEMMGLSATV